MKRREWRRYTKRSANHPKNSDFNALMIKNK
jgi:hypothetical protein